MSPALQQNGVNPAGPPQTIDLSLQAGGRLVRYHHSAHRNDFDAGVLGKGGFGCVYRYTVDPAFTPPSSLDLSQSNGSTYDSDEAETRATAAVSRQQKSDKSRSYVPSVVAVKICRTPCSGSFDELPKTGLQDKRKRRADMLDDQLSHVRIVRGEGRIFTYLQAARQKSCRIHDPPLVKLLANLSPSGHSASVSDPAAYIDDLSSDSDMDDGPPTRLLVFEKMVELDYEQTAHGWVKSSKPWTHAQVEKAAIEIIQGLQFLHEHNVTHGDLKPSNLMLDPRTGVVKIIDLGASRRFVLLSNRERNNRGAVEEQDCAVLQMQRCVTKLAPHLCEGLGSLTGSPYYMAPEILIQATRYTDASRRSRSVLEDYEPEYRTLLHKQDWPLFVIGLNDLKRGWGVRADVWSWACTVQALLLRTLPEEQRPSTSTISPFDFSFSKHKDEMLQPMYAKSPEEENVPRFHQWCRALPLLIVRVTLEPAKLPPQASMCSKWLRTALRRALQHQDHRPTADDICEFIESATTTHGDDIAEEEVQTLASTCASPKSSAASRCDSLGETREGLVTAEESRPGSRLVQAGITEDLDTSSRASALMAGFDMVSPSVPSKEPSRVELPRPPLPCKLPFSGVARSTTTPYWMTEPRQSSQHVRGMSMPATAIMPIRNPDGSAYIGERHQDTRSCIAQTPARERPRPSTGSKPASIRNSRLFSTLREKHDKFKYRLASQKEETTSAFAPQPPPIIMSPKQLLRRLFTWQSNTP